MKKPTTFKPADLIWLLFIAILPLLGACQKENGMGEEGTVPLREIPEHEEYVNLPLIGTKWHLIGFADGKTRRVKTIDVPNNDSLANKYFTVMFHSPADSHKWLEAPPDNLGVNEGFSSVNRSMGHYIIEEEQRFKEFTFGLSTLAGESPDGYLFIEKMKNVDRFDISARGLSLYYDSKSYLLFKPLIE